MDTVQVNVVVLHRSRREERHRCYLNQLSTDLLQTKLYDTIHARVQKVKKRYALESTIQFMLLHIRSLADAAFLITSTVGS